ncbi:hypothetical protein Poli38472_001331 [Pythium oligandrum]|uniref:Carrier domain-containing protein n=1 Tax=Pythium oligandrum TaxID=41045 RepID=A0A8K1CT91_PYTOL|nr:hypothetical protein Poli38472_001331 [Pythium oligandrum]|eukprot:TMW69175.1 hypothetical protein Poli38472_001331 [Pythium oligandrum]
MTTQVARGGDFASLEALRHALDQRKVDEAVHSLLLVLGDADNGTQRRRLETLQRVIHQVETLIKMQQVELTPGLCQDPVEGCLSYSQLQMYTLQTMAPQSTAYNIVRAVRMSSEPFDLEALQASCEAVMLQHEVLRTRFHTNLYGEPRQRVYTLENLLSTDEMAGRVRVVDYKGDVGSEELGDFIQRSVNLPFDLAIDAPVRFYVVQCASEWIWVAVMHHIVTDPESSGVFWKDLHVFYEQFVHTPTSRDRILQNLVSTSAYHCSYRDYAQWQRTRLQSGALSSSLHYWIQQLSKEIPALELPFDRSVDQGATSRDRPGDVVTFASTPQLQEAFSSLCASQGASMFMGSMAVFHMLLRRLSGVDDIIIGAPTSGRSHEALTGMMGYFVNTLPFRLQADQNASFQTLLQHVREVVLEGFRHMEIPLQKMLEHVTLERTEATGQPVFQVMFAWEGGSDSEEKLCDVALRSKAAKFDLMLSMRYARTSNGDKVLEGSLEYASDVFERATAKRFTDYLLELISQVASNPTEPLASIQMLPEHEQRLLLTEWSVPPVTTDSSEFVDEQLSSQVNRSPQAVALRFEGQMWTYQDLWSHASRIAAALQHTNVTPGVRVGLFLDRGLENIASIVGVLRLKAVFIPLDPEFPSERIQYMLQDSQTQVVITQRHLSAKVQQLASNGLDLLFVEDILTNTSTTLADSETPCPSMSAEETTAYILYTSGSTGNPKGVMVSHANLLTTLQWTIREYGVSSSDIYLQSTTSTLDGSLTQLFSPLLAGGSALITKKNGLHDLQYIASLLETTAVTFCVFVPSYFAMLMDFMDQFPTHVKHVILAGEAFPSALATRFYKKHGRYDSENQQYVSSTCLVNEYGPTEASVTSTFYRLPCEQALNAALPVYQSVPIGRAINDHYLVVLDKAKRLVPTGVIGELYIGGRGVAQGYWNRPDMTSKCFEHPELTWLSDKLGHRDMRWYKTGDLVKFLPDGELIFQGRVDAQVKLRGMRIELQEVKNVMLQSPLIQDAEVLVLQDRLVGFAILKINEGVSNNFLEALKGHLSSRLPIHMVPQATHVVDAWPRTPNGKLDLRALASYGNETVPNKTNSSKLGAEALLDDHSDGSNDSIGYKIVTDILKQAWREVLEVDDEELLTSSSFFELGGNSLSAIRVISLVKSHGLPVKLDAFFRCKTIGEIANGVCASGAATPSTQRSLVPLNWRQRSHNNETGTPPLFLVHCADGTVWKMLDLARRLPFPVFGLQAVHRGAAKSIEELAEAYWKEIQSVQPSGPYRIGGYSFGGRVAHAIAILIGLAGHELLPLTLIDCAPVAQPDLSSEGDVHEYIARAFGWRGSVPQPQDGEDKGNHMSESERELYDQIVINYKAHCALDRMYQPQMSRQKTGKSVLRAYLYKTHHWDPDLASYRAFGIETDVSAIPGTHQTILHSPNVEALANAIIEHGSGQHVVN